MNKKAFTLVELMLVVIIIGILAARILPMFGGKSRQAKIAAAQSDIEAGISIALDVYELENGNYPTTEQGLKALLAKPSSVPIPSNWNGPYLKKRPVDPWGEPYMYKSPGTHNPKHYDLYSYGPDGVEGGGDDVTNWHSLEEEDR